MAKSHLPYQRLVDPEVCRAKSAARLGRTITAVLAVALLAVVLTVVVIGSLLAYAYLLPAPPCASPPAGVQLSSTPCPAATSPVDLGRLLERLDILEREVAELKSECRRGSSPSSGHDNQPSSDGGSSLPEPTSLPPVDGLQKMSLGDAPMPTEEMPTWPEIPTWPAPLADDPVFTPALNSDLGSSSYQPHRHARSKGSRRLRHSQEDEPADGTEGPSKAEGRPWEDEEGTGSGKKKRDKPRDRRCKHCGEARVLVVGKAAHIQGKRGGNIPITDQWIRGLQMWEMSVGSSDYFSLDILGSVTVQESGLYYVYSQVLFYDPNDTVGQSICINEQPRFTCLKSNISAEAKQSTCYIGGVVHMLEGDQVAIKLSIPNVTVALYADTTYFGLFRVA